MLQNPFIRLLLFLFLIVQTISFSQGTWEKITVPINKNLNSVFFTDSLYGWAAGDTGMIIHTTDGGNTWVTQDSQTNNEIPDIFFLNRNLGWATSLNYQNAPFGTVLLKTTNGGTTWILQPYPEENAFMMCILFMDSLHGWMGGMGGKPHTLVETTDGGISWHQAAIDSSTLAFFPVLRIHFYNEKYGYACGGMHDIAGVIWRTTNGGVTWSALDPSFAPADEVHELYLYDSTHVIGAGGDPDFGYGVGMIRTSDGGQNWNYQELGLQGAAYDIDFRNDKEAWAPLGSQRKLIYSMDVGSTWTQISTPDSTAIFDMQFPDSLHGFAVGANGSVLKYKPMINGLEEPGGSLQTDSFILYQNYPNPFSRETTIKFHIPSGREKTRIEITICNIFGQVISSLVNERLPSGDHEIIVDARDLSEGVYLIRLEGGTYFSTVHRMILLK